MSKQEGQYSAYLTTLGRSLPSLPFFFTRGLLRSLSQASRFAQPSVAGSGAG